MCLVYLFDVVYLKMLPFYTTFSETRVGSLFGRHRLIDRHLPFSFSKNFWGDEVLDEITVTEVPVHKVDRSRSVPFRVSIKWVNRTRLVTKKSIKNTEREVSH